MKRLCLIVVGGCAAASPRVSPSRPPAQPWRCYARDASQPAAPQGEVTYIRERLDGDRFESTSIANTSRGVLVTRVVWARQGDHFQATLGDAMMTMWPLNDEVTASRMRYVAPSGYTFGERESVADGVLTVTSIDDAPGGPVETAVRFLPVACAVVEAELAKYPG